MALQLFFGFALGVAYCHVRQSLKRSKQQIGWSKQQLAEACLTKQLFTVCRADVDEWNWNYKSYDGTKLPPLSGYNLTNALTTYISHGGEKSKAIDRYLYKNLRTAQQLDVFFNEPETSNGIGYT